MSNFLDLIRKQRAKKKKVKFSGTFLEYLEEKVGSLEGKNILVLGLAFKPDTDDVRESVSIKLMEYLNTQRCNITAHDPISINNAKKIIDFDVNYVKDWKKELSNNDLYLIVH